LEFDKDSLGKLQLLRLDHNFSGLTGISPFQVNGFDHYPPDIFVRQEKSCKTVVGIHSSASIRSTYSLFPGLYPSRQQESDQSANKPFFPAIYGNPSHARQHQS
jgi:hypothetical protein